MEHNNKKDKKSKLLILLLLLITVIAVSVTIWAVFIRDNTPTVLTPDYAPVETEEHAEEIPNDTDEQMESSEGGGAVSLTYTDEVSIDLSEKQASLLFGNPGKSNQDAVIQIIIQDEIIVQSGTLKPGHQVTTLDLLDGADKLLSEGTYKGKLNILYYNQESGEKAILNTEIPVDITVTQ